MFLSNHRLLRRKVGPLPVCVRERPPLSAWCCHVLWRGYQKRSERIETRWNGVQRSLHPRYFQRLWSLWRGSFFTLIARLPGGRKYVSRGWDQQKLDGVSCIREQHHVPLDGSWMDTAGFGWWRHARLPACGHGVRGGYLSQTVSRASLAHDLLWLLLCSHLLLERTSRWSVESVSQTRKKMSHAPRLSPSRGVDLCRKAAFPCGRIRGKRSETGCHHSSLISGRGGTRWR